MWRGGRADDKARVGGGGRIGIDGNLGLAFAQSLWKLHSIDGGYGSHGESELMSGEGKGR